MLSLVLLANVLFTPKEAIQVVFGDKAEVMTSIALCESGLRQFDDNGNVLVSKTNDSGIFQVNRGNFPALKKMGIDPDDSLGNILAANYILQTQGLKAWTCYKGS